MEKEKHKLRQFPARPGKSVFRRYGDGKPLQDALNERLYNKMVAEQEHYKAWLMAQPPEEILKHANEHTVREDIIYALEENSLGIDQARALLKSPCPLGDIYKDWSSKETDYMEELFKTIQSRAERDIKREKEREEAR